ncbi:aminodeoxychorismate lyase [Stanieria cyanosphaera PCC 7437]|uniref:Endolytic murein transglycosylase n=1 Tax=Stanieria cyanosphaera (strain ATCC 29371 / PCC 7437) TaxID=111780 RepID=K9XN84_STAC7|nr:aminodeoxychorismate lyase [Stanieria cyanosphaera PCC 7437]
MWWRSQIAPSATQQQNNSSLEPIQFTVSPGTAGQQIGQQLIQAGLIKSSEAWKLWVWWQQKQDPTGGFKAGTYLLSPQDNLPAIAEKIWRGELMQTKFTIPEGWSIQQMAQYFESVGYFSAEDFVAAASKIPTDKYPWLPPNLPHLEGFLYPDTYKISSDRIGNPQDIIEVMLNQFQQIALPVYQENKKQTNLSLLEWVTLASIVEKEAVVKDERGLIAGVFTQRLKRGMTLGSDPTVEYGLGIKQTADRPLTFAEVATPSPYNTYINAGLPPTPIASPGIASLEATLKPESTEYLYFVARYDGTHVFSKTLAEHEAATKQIRRQRQNQL